MKRKTPIWAFILAIFLILIFNLPFINVVMTSLKTTADISKSPPPLIFRPTLKHYRNIFTNPTFSFLNFLVNSSVIALSSAVFSILLCLPASYAMVRYGIGRKFIFPFSVSLRAIPLIIFAVPIYILFKSVGLIDTRLGIVIIHTLVDIPLALMLLVNFIQDIPREIEEAARIDGASDLNILIKIVVPMIASPLVAVFILSFIYSWNEFLFALILSIKKSTTLTVGASLFITAWGVQWGNIAAAITVSVIPPLILTFYVQKYLVEAFTGGLKE
ncbi:MAG: carbohydrate ABC transporter permease [Thermotoga sp.]|nr:carbohydrate ABC transporter permease [Candidatus Neomarinimicrobiota bacterium]RKX53546.1 MAG: carbohydrate ABC transporter permease [Thermotoga sp.]RKX57071.1 MAG: carbohydrate ABC transporter permease [Thermotoga sp.]